VNKQRKKPNSNSEERISIIHIGKMTDDDLIMFFLKHILFLKKKKIRTSVILYVKYSPLQKKKMSEHIIFFSIFRRKKT